jgi:NosR/NirI family nitrous oxide reductase transcriptional regulator
LEEKKLSNHKHSRQFFDRLMAVIALSTILAAYIFGLAQAKADVMPAFRQLMPSAQRFEKISDSVFAGYRGEQILGYVAIGEATGYGGPLMVAVAVTPQGMVNDFVIVDDRETDSYLIRVKESGLLEALIGKSCQDTFRIGKDVDAVSGATYTSEAIAGAVGKGCHGVMAGGLGGSAAYEASAKIQIGVPEITLILLFAVGFYGHRAKFKYTRHARWVSMIAGLIILGFWLNRPLTIANLNQILLGFWPAWQSHLYWYLLVFGVILVLTIDGKNPYCDWFCPFGAAQECLGVIGQAKIGSPGKFKGTLKWLQRGFAWLAIILALIFRNPSISSYEVFGALFARVGTTVSFTLLVIVLIASLLMKRPWCNYLCPVRPVTDFIHMLRRSAIELWKM